MTSIYSGKLYNSFVTDQNRFRLANYDVNRFQKTIEQSSAQGRLEKELRDGLEFHQAIMADLQTKLNELTEKLNNIYRRYMDNKIAFNKPKNQYDTNVYSDAVSGLPRVDDPAYGNTNGYPAGANGILPYDDYDKIRNFSYNPYFGSKAIEESDLNTLRTYWEQPGTTSENTYRENGAFWSSLSYLWGWDLDRINATYVTESGLPTDPTDDVQINITALQPNKPQYPPVSVGDRFPINWTGNGTVADYPAVNIGGLRPGGVDYSHATDTINTTGDGSPITVSASVLDGNGTPGNPIRVNDASQFQVNDTITVIKNDDPSNPITVTITGIDDSTVPHLIYTDSPAGSNNSSGTISKTLGLSNSGAAQNVTGKDETNFGWEFDDLPISLEVVSVAKKPDGTTVPTEYRVVYDIPPSHPHYESLKVLNGTEPMVMDAPTEFRKDRIANEGFDYTGFAYIPGTVTENIVYVAPDFKLSGYTSGTELTPANILQHALAENEWPPPKAYASTSIPGQVYSASGESGTAADPAMPINGGGNPSILDFVTGETVTVNGSQTRTITAIQDNEMTAVSAAPGEIGVNGSLSAFAVNDYISFDTPEAAGALYRIATISTSGFTYTQVRPTTPAIDPMIVFNSTNVINHGASLPPVPAPDPLVIPAERKFAQEGLVFNSPVAGTTSIKKADVPSSNEPIVDIVLYPNCDQRIEITEGTKVSMRYRFNVDQNYGQLPYRSPGDDGLTPGVNLPNHPHTGYEWTSNGLEYNSPIGDNTFGGQNQNRYPVSSLPFSTLTNTLMNAGPDDGTGSPFFNGATLGVAPSINSTAAGGNAAWVDGIYENVVAVLENDPDPNSNAIHLKVFFNGDLNGFQFEAQDIQIETYGGDLNTWTQGQYVDGGNTAINNNGNNLDGDPDITLDSADVINKYVPGVYQFTQFNDQYNLSHSATDRNDILRSPWEFASLNIDSGSNLSGEMSLDLNSRRLNLDHDVIEGTTSGWAEQNVAVSNPGGGDFLMSSAVQSVHDFVTVVHPDDDCKDYDYVRSDSDPLTTVRNDTLLDEVLVGEAPQVSNLSPDNPIRANGSNPATVTPSGGQPSFYSLGIDAPNNVFVNHPFTYGAETDSTNTVDRVGANDADFSYKISIPTNDVNVLRNENNLQVNFGSMQDTDWTIGLRNMYMDVRNVPSYQTVPRYRVDAGGNIYDRFGDGYHDPVADADAVSRIYTFGNIAPGQAQNGQISNQDGVAIGNYDSNPTGTYDPITGYYNSGVGFEAAVNGHDRLSMADDDFNLFDYTPDLAVDPSSREGATLGEVYVGSLASNFYYYRELLDDSQAETGTAPTGGRFNDDKRAAINFDGRNSNLDGSVAGQHTTIHNTDMPSFTNVRLGIVEQNAKLYNTESTTTHAVWQDFPGLDTQPSYALRNVLPTSNVTDPIKAVGNSNQTYASMGFNNSTMTLDMGKPINQSGYLVFNERGDLGADGQFDVRPHAIPLPLVERPLGEPYDDTQATNTQYSFNAYGEGTVTRTGSKFMPFSTMLDGADGQIDGNTTYGRTALEANGGEFAVDPSLGAPNSWQGVLLHVDDASKFDMQAPRNTVTLGESGIEYRIAYRNTTTQPQSLYLVREDGTALAGTLPGATTTSGLVHADLQVRELTGTYTVSVRDSAGALSVDGQFLRVDYNANGTEREGNVVSVGLSSVRDRVGRLPGDDPRTATVETIGIGPEVFESPEGYVQPDAQVDLALVSQDKDGNLKPRKLTKIKVEVKSGEQIIPADLQQIYSTFNESLDPLNGDPAGNDFDLRGGAYGNWPIAVYEGDAQINPEVTGDLGYLVGYYQGIVGPLDKQDITVVNASDFKVGQLVSINGEQRTVQSISGNTVTLDEPLINEPILGDRLNIGDGSGKQDLQLFLNRSFAMSMGAGLKITLEYEEYDYVGYPPTVDKTSPRIVNETVGFSDDTPKSTLAISPTNTGTGAPGSPIAVSGNLADYAVGDVVSVNGITFSIADIVAGGIELGRPEDSTVRLSFNPGDAPTTGNVSHKNYENYLTVGNGRTGGSSDNDFTLELKRVLDNPEYKDVFRQGLYSNIFITASVTDPFNDVIASKLFLNWDRQRKEIEIQQVAFSAYYQSI